MMLSKYNLYRGIKLLKNDIKYFGSSTRVFNKLTELDINHFKAMFNNDNLAILTDSNEIKPYNTDWLNKYHGYSKLVIKPKTTDQISNVLKYCNSKNLAVVPQGGNTGLVGGATPINDEIILSLSRMNKVVDFDDLGGVLVCEAGCILENLETYCNSKGFTMPLDLGAKGSCQIGGNLSTNAGGLRLVRYGSLHGAILGLEVVTADGTIISNLNTLRKDNTGYDWKQLFVGGEGTLGIITKASLLTYRKPKNIQVAYLAAKSFEDILALLNKARDQLGEIISAIEFQDHASFELVINHGAKNPLSTSSPFYLLIETAGSNATHDQEKLNSFLENVLESNLATDGTVAQDETQSKSLWRLREGIAEAAGKTGSVFKYDVSIPTKDMFKLVEETKERMGKDALCVGYGHLGDSNLHLNVIVKNYTKEFQDKLEPFVFERVQSYGGSISAEHGIGQNKPKFLNYSKPKEAIDLMKQIKNLMDPKGILNPGKVFE